MSGRGPRIERIGRIEWLAGLALLGCLPTTHEREPLDDAPSLVERPRCPEGSASVASFDAHVIGELAQVEVVRTFENHGDRPITIADEFALRGWTLVDHAIEIADLRMRDLVVTREQAYASQAAPAVVEVVPRATDAFARRFELLPGESGRVELLLARELDVEAARTTLTLPTRASGCELDVMVTLESTFTASSPTHAITSVSTERATHLALAQPESDDRDFELTWRRADADDVHATLWLVPDGHFTLIVEPPTHADPAQAIARELIWLEGDDASPDSAEALARATTLAGLRADDAMVVIPSDHVRHVEFERALAHHPERLHMLVLGLDVMPPSKPLADTRVFGLADSDPASPTRLRLLDALPRRSRGAGVVRREGELDPMLAERFARRIASPLLVDLELDWGDAQVEFLTLARLPDLFAEHSLVLHGRVRGPLGSLVLHGRDRVGRRAITIEIRPTQTTDSRGLATITNLERIDALFGVNRERLPCFPDGREDQALALALALQQPIATTCVVAVIEQAGAPTRLDPIQPRCDIEQASSIESREPFRDLDKLGGLLPIGPLPLSSLLGATQIRPSASRSSASAGRRPGFE
ncbi:hypothetical protein ACNOYE_07160 [Nannocystaceae bacterium ST9]